MNFKDENNLRRLKWAMHHKARDFFQSHFFEKLIQDFPHDENELLKLKKDFNARQLSTVDIFGVLLTYNLIQEIKTIPFDSSLDKKTHRVYVIRFFEGEETEFIKVGITKNKANTRGRSIPYKYEILYESRLLSNSFAKSIEDLIKTQFKENRYFPKKEFGGMVKECFKMHVSVAILSLIKDLVNKNTPFKLQGDNKEVLT